MTVPFEAIDAILEGARRINTESGTVLNTSGDMPIGQLMNFRDSMQSQGDALRTQFGALLGLYAANPAAPTGPEVTAANTGIATYLEGRVRPDGKPMSPVTLFATVYAQGAAVMDAIENDDGTTAGINGVHRGVERTLNRTTNFYEPLMITKTQRRDLDAAITALRATLSPLF